MSGRLIIALVLAMSCQVVPRWELRTGLPPIDVCDGGTHLAEEPKCSFESDSRPGTPPLLPVERALICSPELPRFITHNWECAHFEFLFSTDETGRISSICAWSVPNAAEYVECLADRLREVSFEPNQANQRYSVRWSVD